MNERIRQLTQRQDCDYLEIRYQRTHSTSFRFMGNRLEDLAKTQSSGFAIRALVDGAWGFTTFNNPNELEVQTERVIAAARAASKAEKADASLAAIEPVEMTIRVSPKTDPREVPLEDKLATFRAYNDIILAQAGVSSSSVSYFDTFTNVIFATSEGTFIDRERLDLACSIAAIASRDGDTRIARVSQGSTDDYAIVLGLEEEVRQAAADAVAKLDAPVISAGTYTVVCDPHLAGVFVHEAFGHLSEGDNVADDDAMKSILTMGRNFGPDYLNIFDSGLEVGQRGHVPVDDEGVPTEKTYLIRGGKLVGRLHNRESAAKMGERPTGNARALSFRHPPIPRMRNTCIEPGPHGSLEDIIKDVELGVYAIDAAGGQTNGEVFTFTAADAFMIRNGKLAERVKDVTISGNVFETLNNIDRIGSGFENRDSAGGCGKAGQMPLPVSHGAPHIRIRECVIGGQ